MATACDGQCGHVFLHGGWEINCVLSENHIGPHTGIKEKLTIHPDDVIKLDVKQIGPDKDKLVFPSGASSSKIPRYDLIPAEALRRIADRFQLGLEEHKERSWNARSSQKPLEDKEWVIARAAHVIDHAYKLIEKLTGAKDDDGDDDAAAIAWGGICLIQATAKKEDK